MGLDEISVSRSDEENIRKRLVESLDVERLRAEDLFGRQVEVAASVCDTPVAVVALVDTTHVHTLSAVGVEPRSRPRDDVLGGRVVDLGRSLVIEDLSNDEQWAELSPSIDGEKVCFYFGHPLMIDSSIPVGTLTVIDFSPRRISAHQRAVFTSIARQVELQIEYLARQHRTIAESQLAAQIAVSHHVSARRQALTNYLLHDAINAATAVKADADYVRNRTTGGRDVQEALDDIAESVDAMADLLHSAREILLDPDAALTSFGQELDLESLVRDLVELHSPQLGREARNLEVVGSLDQPCISGEPKLLSEMFESLLGASLAATPPGTDIEIRLGEPDPSTIEIRYSDRGDAKADTVHQHSSAAELSLGDTSEFDVDVVRDSTEALSLCNMIVEAHGGTMRAEAVDHTGRQFLIHLPR